MLEVRDIQRKQSYQKERGMDNNLMLFGANYYVYQHYGIEAATLVYVGIVIAMWVGVKKNLGRKVKVNSRPNIDKLVVT
jgi:hypothetical protein